MTLLTDFIIIFGIIISLGLIILIIKLKNKGLDKNLLVTIFSLIFFTNLHAYSTLHDLEIIYYLSFIFDYNLFWVLGPVLLIYVKSLFFDNEKLFTKHIYHFLPSIFLTLFIFIPEILAANIRDINLQYLEYAKEHLLILIIVRDIYFILYLIISVRLFLKLKSALRKKLSFSIKEYRWVYKLLLGCLIFVSIDLFIRSFELFFFNLNFDGGYITLISIIIFLAYLGYNGISKFRMLIPTFLIENNEKATILFTEEETKIIEQKIRDTLEADKLYLDETLSLKKLSDRLQISDKKLSAFLNNHLNSKFKDYINFYRVEAVKEKLKSAEYDKFTLLAISEECGFNSKASFYRIFKKHTGVSPSQFKKSMK